MGENNNFLVKNYWLDIKVIWHKWSLGDPPSRLINKFDLMKNIAARGRSQFSLWLFRESLKNDLLKA